MGCFRSGVAMVLQQRGDPVEQLAAACGDPWHILEQDQLGRVVRPGLEREPDTTQRQPVECLIFVGEAAGLG